MDVDDFSNYLLMFLALVDFANCFLWLLMGGCDGEGLAS